MITSSTSRTLDGDPFQPLIAEVPDAQVRCESVDRDALIEKHHDYLESLRQFFTEHDRME